MTQALYRKWRPKLWEEVVGQDHIVQTLKNAIAADRVGHAYLFSGPRGTGKTTTARLLAKAVNCTSATAEKPCDQCPNCLSVNEGSFLDLIEMDAASNTGVEYVRDLRENINFAPNLGRYKIYIIDEVHMFSNSAFNALLKTLEEPPPHAIFILATTELHKIPPTILSRCQRYEFRRIPVSTISDLLRKKVDEEGFDVQHDVLTIIARQATGSMRDAISLLDQLASTTSTITLDLTLSVLGTATNTAVTTIVDCMILRETGKALDQLQLALDGGTEARQLARQMVEYFRNILLAKNGNVSIVDTTLELREVIFKQAEQLQTRHLISAIDRFNGAASDSRRSGWQPGLAFELALVETIEEMKESAIVRGAQGNTESAKTSDVVTSTAHVTEDLTIVSENNPHKGSVEPAKKKIQSRIEEKSKTVEEVVEAPAVGTEFTTIDNNWRKIVETVRKYNPLTQSIVLSCQPASIKGGCLYLAFSKDYEFLKLKMEENDHIEHTRRAVQVVTGLDYPIRCIVGDSKSATTSKRNMEKDGMVSTALRELGGQVVKEQDIKENDQEK